MGPDNTTLLSTLVVDDLRTLSYAAAFLRDARTRATSIAVTLPAYEGAAAAALERVCALAVEAAPLEVDIEFATGHTTVCLSRVGSP